VSHENEDTFTKRVKKLRCIEELLRPVQITITLLKNVHKITDQQAFHIFF